MFAVEQDAVALFDEALRYDTKPVTVFGNVISLLFVCLSLTL